MPFGFWFVTGAVGVVGAFGVVVAVDEDPVLFSEVLLAVLAPLGAFGGGDEDSQKRDCE